MLVNKLAPIQEKRLELVKDKGKIEKILKDGAEKANAIAKSTMSEVKKAIGI
jgi:tryptophanyl-tRNA synthetase